MPFTYQWTSHCPLTRWARSFKSWSWASKDCSFFWTSKSFSGLILEEQRVIENTGKPQKHSQIFSIRPAMSCHRKTAPSSEEYFFISPTHYFKMEKNYCKYTAEIISGMQTVLLKLIMEATKAAAPAVYPENNLNWKRKSFFQDKITELTLYIFFYL